MRQVYINGKFVPETEAKISIYDSSLMFGDMVFEMTRSFNKNQFKLKEHLVRLYDSLKYVHIPLRMSIDEMEKACLETIEKNEPFFKETDEHRLMINVSRGPLSIYSEIFDGKLEPLVIISDFPLKWTVSGMGDLFDTGINAVIPSQRAIPSYLLDAKIKNRSRIHYMMANIEVSNLPGSNNWPLLLDPDGFIAEGTGDNFFIVKDGELYTPEPRNILRGISRQYVFDLANELGIKYHEKNLELYDVVTSDEAFMTGTPFCMLPVTKINGMNISNGNRGNIFNSLLSQWSDNVGLNIEQQIKTFNSEMKNYASEGSTPYRFKND
ncbi:putative branched-chain-amino-acid aminotransferase protein [Marine Group I thaumarchaeote SCGC AAA799-B03]|uniref:Putative branched-chain-amino-acid aminotransferase protein n=1 Tax=Marine Group I thaumarchaeote SCGC AAA799-B03 TaxID=1502289 RepID=A0A087S6M5_9ARCH|nr:putative branched-chain-amino-acid aminotransferase protein [Marine Group I thaumarchaeote SCGC AAA799-B03]